MKRRIDLVFGFFLVASLWANISAAAAALPDDSIYRIPALRLVDQDGKAFEFASLSGRPRLVGMFYGSCRMACPVEIESVKRIQAAVRAAGGRPIAAILVSFDPAHDTVPMLRMAAAEHHLRGSEFELARPQQGDYRALGAVLGIAWRPLPGGGFEHNTVIALLDAQGRIVATTDGRGKVPTEFVRAVLAREGMPLP